MTNEQATNVLDWVEALLSGKYKHSKHGPYNPNTDSYTSLGVAMEINDIPIYGKFTFKEEKANAAWFTEHFGLKATPMFYASMDYYGNSFLAVAVLLLDAVPNHSAAIKNRKVDLNALLQQRQKEENSRAV